jgi:trimethylamine--corrinoid protein Co-methyltransferase
MKTERFQVLNNDDLKKIDESSIKILGEVGIRVDSEEAASILHDGGAETDGSSPNMVKIPEHMIRDALKKAPSHIRLYDRTLEKYLELGSGRGAAAAGHNAVKFMDHETGRQRPATCADCDDFIKLVDALDDYEAVAVPIMPQDVPSKSTILHGFLHTVINTEKHIYFSPDSADATDSILDMARTASGGTAVDLSEHSPVTCQLSPTSPLTWDREAADGLIACAEAGVPLSFLPEPFSGMTGPVTVAGLLAQHNAELLSGLVLAQLARPGTPVIYGSAWTTFDMKKANVLICSPETAALRVAGVQMARYYGLPSHTIGPDGDAHIYDEQLGWEKLLTAISGIGAGVDLIVNGGLFDSAWTVSLEQALLDAEILSICRRFMQGVTVNGTTLALDTIAEAGPGGHFMESVHTLEQLRAGALWEAAVSNTHTSKQWDEMGRPTVQQNASEKVDRILASHEPPGLRPGITDELKTIVSSFELSHSEG